MVRPGPRNLITDVAGLRVGQAEDARVRTGVTVVLARCADARRSSMCAAARPARAIPKRSIPSVSSGAADAIVLSGGSAFGLDAPSGVSAFLRAQGRGFEIGRARRACRSCPGAILFDLANGGDKDWGDEPPYRALGREAGENASARFRARQCGRRLWRRRRRLQGRTGQRVCCHR